MNFPQNLKSNKACRILTQDAAGFIGTIKYFV